MNQIQQIQILKIVRRNIWIMPYIQPYIIWVVSIYFSFSIYLRDIFFLLILLILFT